MSKVFLSTLVAALVCVAVSNAKAEGVSANTLSDMGLSALTVMSDSDAMSVRGKGFSGHRKLKDCVNCGPRGSKSPSSRAFGNSFATINLPKEEGGAHSENGYIANGPYGASGDNYSEAGSEVTNVEIVDIDGAVRSVTTTCITKVWAGGNSSAMSF